MEGEAGFKEGVVGGVQPVVECVDGSGRAPWNNQKIDVGLTADGRTFGEGAEDIRFFRDGFEQALEGAEGFL